MSVQEVLRLELVQQINGHPAAAFAISAHHQIQQAGEMADNNLLISWDDEAIVAYLGKEPCGVITFQHVKWLNEFQIKIGFVSPERRGSGIYRSLWDRLVSLAEARGCGQIIGTTMISNHRMREIAKALGRHEHGIILTYKVPTT